MNLWMIVAVLPVAAAAAQAADPPGLVHMTQEQQKTVKLQTAPAARRPITVPIHVPGNVTYELGHVSILRPFGQARVTSILVGPGQLVTAGQVVAELDMPSLLTAEQDLLTARAQIRESTAAISVARAALDRAVLLVRDGSMAQAEADRRRLVLVQAQAQAEAARDRVAALEAAVSRLGSSKTPGIAALRSTIPGIVVALNVTPGEVVQPGDDILTVADLTTVLVTAAVPERSAADVAVNDPAMLSLPGGGRRWDGRITALAAALDPQARTLPVRVPVANPDGALRIGMFVDVTITSIRGRESTTVPSSAVQLVADKQVVFTPAAGDGFQSHDVQLGVQQPDWDEVLGGAIKPGEQVVTTGSFDLKALLQKSMLGGG